MDLVGGENRIRALFSELSFEDQSSIPEFEELCKRRLVPPAPVGGFRRSAVMIAVTLLLVAGCSLGAWSWYRFTRSSMQNAAELAPPETSTPPLRVQKSEVQELHNRKSAAPVVKSPARHRKNLARLRPTDRAVIRDAALLSRWQSPTLIFLESPAGFALNSLPQLNQSAEQLKLFLPGNTELKKELNQ